MQDKRIAECSNNLPFVFKTFALSIFEWQLKTGFTVFFISSACELLAQKEPSKPFCTKLGGSLVHQ